MAGKPVLLYVRRPRSCWQGQSRGRRKSRNAGSLASLFFLKKPSWRCCERRSCPSRMQNPQQENIKLKITNKITHLFTDRISTVDLSSSSKSYIKLVRFVKLARITVDTFAQSRMGFQCVALSYFVALSIIPFVAFIFAITGGLGLSDKVAQLLYSTFPSNAEFDSLAMEKANNIINSAKSGGVGVVSAMMFLWTILWMMFQVERVFNNVWGIRKIPRKIYKRFGFYFLVLFLSPFLIIIFGTGIAYYTNLTKLVGLDLRDITFLPRVLGYLTFYGLSAFTLSIMYKYIPSVKVNYKYALKSGAIAGLVFVIFQYLYLETQMFVGRLNSTYGVIAAVPLFLIWLNFSWQIIMYGAELTYGYQNIDKYNIPTKWDSDNKQ